MGISFDKLQAQAPELVSLAKKAQFNLSKHGLDGQRAKVALCLDHSGSMRGVYADGQMQALAARILAMATQMDDDGSIDVHVPASSGLSSQRSCSASAWCCPASGRRWARDDGPDRWRLGRLRRS